MRGKPGVIKQAVRRPRRRGRGTRRQRGTATAAPTEIDVVAPAKASPPRSAPWRVVSGRLPRRGGRGARGARKPAGLPSVRVLCCALCLGSPHASEAARGVRAVRWPGENNNYSSMVTDSVRVGQDRGRWGRRGQRPRPSTACRLASGQWARRPCALPARLRSQAPGVHDGREADHLVFVETIGLKYENNVIEKAKFCQKNKTFLFGVIVSEEVP